MKNFDSYAKCYDLIYGNKNYSKEVDYIDQVIRRHSPGARTILEFGCGTGVHATHLVEKGYAIHGVDRSEEMLSRASSRWSNLSTSLSSRITSSQGDIRNVELGNSFDVVIALFHVISYLPTDSDLNAAFSVARRHLKSKGLFMFDFWYGPGVLCQQPATRRRALEDGNFSLVRIAEPTLYPNENLVDVFYQFNVLDKSTGLKEEFQEVHRMRYLFLPELRTLLMNHGFELIRISKWLMSSEPEIDTWSAFLVGQVG